MVGVGVTLYILIRCAVRFFFFNFVPGQNYLVNNFYDFVCFLCVWILVQYLKMKLKY